MASGSLGGLVVSLTAETAQFTAALDRASYTSRKNFADISSYAKTAAGSLAALYGVGSIAGFVKQQIDLADSTGKMAQKVGISVEELSKLQYAAKLADVDTAQLQVGLVKLSRGMVEAANGTGQAQNAFAALGVNIKNADGSLKSSGDVLNDVAGKFAQYEDGANKTALAVQLFGKAGADLIPLLNAGAEGIKQSADELERFGGVITTAAAKNAELFNDNLERLATVGSALGKSIANEVMPYLNQLSTEFLVARSNGLGFMEMLSMGLRSTDYAKQLVQIEDQLKSVNNAWAFPIGPSRDERIASLEKQKKTIIDLQTIMMKDKLAGPARPTDTPTQKAPFSIDLEKLERDREKAAKEAEKLADNYAKGFGRAQDANDKFVASIREMGQKAQLEIDAAFMTEPQKRFAEDMISINKSFLDTQAEVTKQYNEGRLKIADYNAQATILAGTYQLASEQALQLKEQQDVLNNSWEYGATKALNSYANQVMNISNTVSSAFNAGIKSMEDSLVNFVMTGSLNFTALANSMISDMIRIMIQQRITGPLANAGASFFGSVFGAPGGGGGGAATITDYSTPMPSFDGGGFTGSGSRSGGRDGKGGFLALLHPNESVIDHSKGGASSGSSSPSMIQINVQNNASGDGYQASATSTESNGKNIIDIVVEKVKSSMNQDVRSNGNFSQTFANAYGLRRSM